MDEVFQTWVADNWNFKWKHFFILKLLPSLSIGWGRGAWVRTGGEREMWRTVRDKNNLRVEIHCRRDKACQVQPPVQRKKSSPENSHAKGKTDPAQEWYVSWLNRAQYVYEDRANQHHYHVDVNEHTITQHHLNSRFIRDTFIQSYHCK